MPFYANILIATFKNIVFNTEPIHTDDYAFLYPMQQILELLTILVFEIQNS